MPDYLYRFGYDPLPCSTGFFKLRGQVTLPDLLSDKGRLVLGLHRPLAVAVSVEPNAAHKPDACGQTDGANC